MDDDLIERLENYRRQCKNIPSKSEAVRTLLDEALKKYEKRAQPKVHKKKK
ncbi:MAG: hypothetical protein QNL11_10030 [Desulfobacterales bacterium]|nr:hypothetical protein [Desulfobacterales bacterium]